MRPCRRDLLPARQDFGLQSMAGATGLEPATSGVTGRRSNQLSYAPAASTQAGTPTPPTGECQANASPTEPGSGLKRLRAVVGDDGLEPPTLSV
jgi:hypothetical protein